MFISLFTVNLLKICSWKWEMWRGLITNKNDDNNRVQTFVQMFLNHYLELSFTVF